MIMDNFRFSVLQNVLRKSVTRPRAVDKSADKVLVKGWLTKVSNCLALSHHSSPHCIDVILSSCLLSNE